MPGARYGVEDVILFFNFGVLIAMAEAFIGNEMDVIEGLVLVL